MTGAGATIMGPASAVAPYRSGQPAGRDGFAHLVRAEWTKFRTVRGWMVGLAAGVLVTLLVGVVSSLGSHTSCSGGGGTPDCHPVLPIGPDGEAVTDLFHFVHQPMTGDGSITVKVASLAGSAPADLTGPASQAPLEPAHPLLSPWAKAGLMVKQSTAPGSAYAAVMVTGTHGVRMQSDFIRDMPGQQGSVSPGAPRWLRLTRSGATLTGYASADGTIWTRVGSAHLAGLSPTVQAGLFVTSPEFLVTGQHLGGASSIGGPTQATAVFDQVSLQAQGPRGAWAGTAIGGGPGGEPAADPYQRTGGRFTVSGSGDVAPAVAGPDGNTVERSLVGAFAGLIVLIVLGTMFVTSEYRRGLIRTTISASPRRGRVLTAKAVVLGAVTFATGLIAAGLAVWVVGAIRRDSGAVVLPVTPLTTVRVVAGTAALMAVAAVLALAVGTVLRRAAGAVAITIVLVVLPYILAVASVLPAGAGQWALRVTPAAGFAIQQSIGQYAQVGATYTPATGYFPLAPWAGFSVLCLWTALALGLAAILLRRRDV